MNKREDDLRYEELLATLPYINVGACLHVTFGEIKYSYGRNAKTGQKFGDKRVVLQSAGSYTALLLCHQVLRSHYVREWNISHVYRAITYKN